jgi:hypothetical protein
MDERLSKVFAAIDLANSKDPLSGGERPRAVLYGERMTAVLDQFEPAASEELQIAARAQHIERWVIPRESYDEGRIGYLKWRKDLQHHHAKRMAEIMAPLGYTGSEIARVGSLLHKERLKFDPEAQALEDVICLVFLKYEAPEFIAKHADDKVRDILAKTAKKMSPKGLAEAGKLKLDERLSRLLTEALATPP